ncbi:hypothetical protein WA026_004731 [Henosepilachna vigintioctopunctata]|uniref:Uncharacterized protein n=1 Tax=Henosepilachna vigintioctopunctata TaxID=420089 RepID=A0AAW1VAW5_9CUCU
MPNFFERSSVADMPAYVGPILSKRQQEKAKGLKKENEGGDAGSIYTKEIVKGHIKRPGWSKNEREAFSTMNSNLESSPRLTKSSKVLLDPSAGVVVERVEPTTMFQRNNKHLKKVSVARNFVTEVPKWLPKIDKHRTAGPIRRKRDARNAPYKNLRL